MLGWIIEFQDCRDEIVSVSGDSAFYSPSSLTSRGSSPRTRPPQKQYVLNSCHSSPSPPVSSSSPSLDQVRPLTLATFSRNK